MGEVVQNVESYRGPRGLFLFKIVRDAVMDFDVGKIEEIIQRIDGGVPESGEMDGTANLIGSALNDVMDLDDIDQVREMRADDPPIITLAKALYIIAVRDCGSNAQKRKDSAKAINIILARTGGRKVKPVRERLETRYEDPDWMKGALPE